MKLRARLPIALVAAGAVALGIGLWALGGFPLVLIVGGSAAIVLGLLMEV